MNGWGNRLKFTLARRKLQQKTVAQLMGVTAPAVYKWVVGGEIEYEKLRRLAALLEVNWVWLRWGEEAVNSAIVATCQDGTCTDYLAHRSWIEAINQEESAEAFLSDFGVGTFIVDTHSRTVVLSRLAAQTFGVANLSVPFASLVSHVCARSQEVFTKAFGQTLIAEQAQMAKVDLVRERRSAYVVFGTPYAHRLSGAVWYMGAGVESSIVSKITTRKTGS